MDRLHFIFSFFLLGMNLTFAQVGINTMTPHPNADLELGSSDKALLLNRVEVDADNNPILATTPTEGMLVYDASNRCVRAYEEGAWTACLSGARSCGDVTFDYNGSSVTYGTVVNPSTGRCWLDRNLGAAQVATSLDDELAYGDYFQWGRGADGHQIPNSATTHTQASTPTPGHGNFIIDNEDWLSPANDHLWQGSMGINNPCPSGFKVPSETEWMEELGSWTSVDGIGAYQSLLKLTPGGARIVDNGDAVILERGILGAYWTSTASSPNSKLLFMEPTSAAIDGGERVFGLPVRCIREKGILEQNGNYFTATEPIYSGSVLEGGVGYYDEPISSTIEVEVFVNELGPYNLSGSVEITKESYITNFTIPTQTLTYTASGNFTTLGLQTLTLTSNGISPKWYGIQLIEIEGSGLTNTKWIMPRIDIKTLPAKGTEVQDVTGVAADWMDRNLGAHRKAIQAIDPLAIGSKFQWGRKADGHERMVYNGRIPFIIESGVPLNGFTNILSTTSEPNHNQFIYGGVDNWMTTDEFDLWDGVSAVNNPCPAGYRVPGVLDFQDEANFWTAPLGENVFNTSLGIIMAGSPTSFDNPTNSLRSGLLFLVAYYWLDSFNSHLFFNDSWEDFSGRSGYQGQSIRCIKN